MVKLWRLYYNTYLDEEFAYRVATGVCVSGGGEGTGCVSELVSFIGI